MADDDFDQKQLVLDSYAAAEERLLARLKTARVAFCAGHINPHIAPHLVEFLPLMDEIDILVLAERHRSRERVESIIQRLPEFTGLPVTISNVSSQRLLNEDLVPADVRCLRMDFPDDGNQRVFVPLQWAQRWAMWIEADVARDGKTRRIAIVVLGGMTAYLALVSLMRQGITPASIVQLEPDE